ncbi:Procollagen-lysine,2-oxoglutarate 5-dioxygenase 3 [Hypsibius exemplaris]|nr:Procollagen-lysine,2-oxoglutarate 5-dioxygenase 3 [Hypsibius exemplaris]
MVDLGAVLISQQPAFCPHFRWGYKERLFRASGRRMRLLHVLAFVLLIGIAVCKNESKNKLVVVTVASNATDGYLRFLRSANLYGYSVEVLGMGQPWLGGDVKRYAGGGYKINLLKKYMENHKDDSKTIYLFTDSYDVIFTASAKTLVKKYLEMKARVVFTAERFCWPDSSLSNSYPPVMGSSKYLNSGGFIGTGQSIYEMLTVRDIADTDDDQLYYTQLYLDPDMRNDLGIKLDYENQIFQALFGSEADVKIRAREDEVKEFYLFNAEHNTEPCVLHGNGLAKDTLNSMANYLAGSRTKTDCLICSENNFKIADLPTPPTLQLGIFIERPTPFLPEFFARILAQDYPKEHIHLFIHNREAYHKQHVADFLEHTSSYASITVKGHDSAISEAEARSLGISECLSHACDYYLSVDSEATLTQPMAITLLMELNRTLLAPMMVRPGKMWSNFWGALSDEGFYSRSEDYGEILDNSKR